MRRDIDDRPAAPRLAKAPDRRAAAGNHRVEIAPNQLAGRTRRRLMQPGIAKDRRIVDPAAHRPGTRRRPDRAVHDLLVRRVAHHRQHQRTPIRPTERGRLELDNRNRMIRTDEALDDRAANPPPTPGNHE
jgi:hypothetical protein